MTPLMQYRDRNKVEQMRRKRARLKNKSRWGHVQDGARGISWQSNGRGTRMRVEWESGVEESGEPSLWGEKSIGQFGNLRGLGVPWKRGMQTGYVMAVLPRE